MTRSPHTEPLFREIAKAYVYETGAAGPEQFLPWLAHQHDLADRFEIALTATGWNDAAVRARWEDFGEALEMELRRWYAEGRAKRSTPALTIGLRRAIRTRRDREHGGKRA